MDGPALSWKVGSEDADQADMSRMKRRWQDEHYRTTHLEYQKSRYHSDPEYRKRRLAATLRWKQERQRRIKEEKLKAKERAKETSQ